jgi:BolA protein
MGTVADAIRLRLTEAFQPLSLEVIDDSDKHSGHSGEREGGESHFTVKVTSSAFTGLNRVERQRRINAALADQFAAGLHALSIKAQAPGE